MDPKWFQVLLVLVFYQKTCFGVNEGERITITCKAPEVGTMIVWFRVLDTSGMEFLISLNGNGMVKKSADNFAKIFTLTSASSIILNSFQKSRDSGIYGCGSLVKGNMLSFGPVTRLRGEKDPTVKPPTVLTVPQPVTSTPASCDCKGVSSKGQVLEGTSSPSFFCTPIILGPLAGGCGLLLLLLLITTIYCNRIRTRRCPHHYKRKPRVAVPEKQMMVNRHV